jgi:hypothetical protein
MEKYIKTYFETYLKDFDFDSIFLEAGADSPHLNFVTDLIEWMMKNPDLAEKNFPGRLEIIHQNLNKVINELPVHYALSIQSLPKEFPKWKTEVNDFFGISKTKKILSYLETIGYFLDKNEYINELEQDIIESVRPELEEHFEYWTKELETIAHQQNITKTEKEIIKIKPVFKSEAVQSIFEILKVFFSDEQQIELKQVIEEGKKANNKLLFKGNGNRLTDTFKKLIEHDFITGCQKKDLIDWIISNFNYTNQNVVKAYIYDTVEKTISRNHYPCKSPLIKIENGRIQKVDQPRIKKYSKS